MNINTYTCRLCGKTKDAKEEPWDYWADGVACEECLKKFEENDG